MYKSLVRFVAIMALIAFVTSFGFGGCGTSSGGGSSGSSAVIPGTPYHLAFRTQPCNTLISDLYGALDGPALDGVSEAAALGGTLNLFSVDVVDTNGNLVTTATNSILITATVTPTGLTGLHLIRGTNCKKAVAGVATFDDIIVGGTVGNYTLTAISTDCISAVSDSFQLNIAQFKLVFTEQPADTGVGELAPTIIVKVEDTYGNIITTATNSITLSGVIPVTQGQRLVLTGNTVTAIAGVATFDAFIVGGLAGTGKQLIASSDDVASGFSNSFALTGFGEVDKFTVTGTAAMNAGDTNTLTITAQDEYGNTNTDVIGNQSIFFSGADASPDGTAPTVQNYAGLTKTFGAPTSLIFTSGVATGAMKLYDADEDTIKASYDEETGTADEDALECTVSALAADKLLWYEENSDRPSSPQVAGTPWEPFEISITDKYGNVKTTDNSTVVSVLTGTGTTEFATGFAGYTATASAGIALYPATTFYYNYAEDITITGTATGLTSTTELAITVNPGAAYKLLWVDAPTTPQIAGTPWDAVTIQVTDAWNNRIITDNATEVTVVTTTGTTLVDPLTGDVETVSAGLATFTIGYTKAETIKVKGIAEDLVTTTTTANIVVGPAALDYFVITGADTMVAGAINAITITAKDEYDNTKTDYTGAHSLVFSGAGNSPAPATVPTVSTIDFGDATATTFAAGVAASKSMKLYKVESAAIVVTCETKTSDALDCAVTVGTATKGLWVQVPTSPQVNGVNFSPAPTIEITDAYGNRRTADSTTSVVLSKVSGTATISSGDTATASSGLATFSALKCGAGSTTIVIKGTPGTLTATVDSAAITINP